MGVRFASNSNIYFPFFQAMEKHKPVLFFLTHGESSAGLCHPVDGIGDICRK